MVGLDGGALHVTRPATNVCISTKVLYNVGLGFGSFVLVFPYTCCTVPAPHSRPGTICRRAGRDETGERTRALASAAADVLEAAVPGAGNVIAPPRPRPHALARALLEHGCAAAQLLGSYRTACAGS